MIDREGWHFGEGDSAVSFPAGHSLSLRRGRSLDLVQSLSDEGYFTHFTAIYLNNLTEQTPKTIYFNVEQRASGGTGQLTQEALNRAFKAEPRLSSNVVEYKGTRIVKVNGRNTDQLGVLAKRHSQCRSSAGNGP